MRAILLAAGLGTRLRPLTNTRPKCLMPIGGEPLLGIWLRRLVAAGVERMLVNTHYLAPLVRDFVMASPWRNRVTLVHEDPLRGTAGTLLANLDFLGGKDGFLIHADNWCLADLSDFISAHRNRPSHCHISLLAFRTDTPSTCGILELDTDNTVIAFHEKVATPPSNLANGAVYLLDATAQRQLKLKYSNATDFSLDVIPTMMGKILAVQTDSPFIDIGNPAAYLKANGLASKLTVEHDSAPPDIAPERTRSTSERSQPTLATRDHQCIVRASFCPACGQNNTVATQLHYVSIRHLDFAPLGGWQDWPTLLCDCTGCGVLYRLLSPTQQDDLDRLYRSSDYATHREDHVVRNEQGVAFPACEAQAELLLTACTLPARPAVLDIGCFDGKLLTALAQRLGPGRYVGYDVAPRSGFPDQPGFEFVASSRNSIVGTFDLVVLSQSLIYITDLAHLLQELTTCLAPGGTVFIHVPDSAQRPGTLLLGDQVFYFTPTSLTGILARHGYTTRQLVATLFPKDLLVLATPCKTALPTVEVGGGLSHLCARLDQLAHRVSTIAAETEVYVLGTTIEASFVHGLIGRRVRCFIDENPSRQRRPFCGKPVLSPSALGDNDVCLVPMVAAQASALAQRLATLYHGQFLPV